MIQPENSVTKKTKKKRKDNKKKGAPLVVCASGAPVCFHRKPLELWLSGSDRIFEKIYLAAASDMQSAVGILIENRETCYRL